MGDFRIDRPSLFDERPDMGAQDTRKRKKHKAAGATPAAEPEDEVELTSEPEGPVEEPAEDFYEPSEKKNEEEG